MLNRLFPLLSFQLQACCLLTSGGRFFMLYCFARINLIHRASVCYGHTFSFERVNKKLNYFHNYSAIQTAIGLSASILLLVFYCHSNDQLVRPPIVLNGRRKPDRFAFRRSSAISHSINVQSTSKYKHTHTCTHINTYTHIEHRSWSGGWKFCESSATDRTRGARVTTDGGARSAKVNCLKNAFLSPERCQLTVN